MKFQINTEILNKKLAAVSKGVGKSSVIKCSEYLKIRLLDNTLYIAATNGVNFTHAIIDEIAGEEGTVIVNANKLLQLVKKTTKAAMTFSSDENGVLTVQGNGKYKLPPYEFAEGEEFPSYTFDEDVESYTIKTALLKNVIKLGGTTIATNPDLDYLIGYYIGAQSIATDGIKMYVNNTPLLPDQPILVSQSMAALLMTVEDEDISVQVNDNLIMFTSDSAIIFGSQVHGIDTYGDGVVPDVIELTEAEYADHVVLPTASLVEALDRLTVFADELLGTYVTIEIARESLTISNDKASETLPIRDGSEVDEGTPPTKIYVDSKQLKTILANITHPTLKLEYAEDGAPVRITENNVSLILSQIDQEEE